MDDLMDQLQYQQEHDEYVGESSGGGRRHR